MAPATTPHPRPPHPRATERFLCESNHLLHTAMLHIQDDAEAVVEQPAEEKRLRDSMGLGSLPLLLSWVDLKEVDLNHGSLTDSLAFSSMVPEATG